MKRKVQRVRFQRVTSGSPIPTTESQHVEDQIARMIASAYASDHPDLFQSITKKHGEQQVSGPVAAAAAVTGAPPVNAAGPGSIWSVEHEEDMGIQRPAARRKTSG